MGLSKETIVATIMDLLSHEYDLNVYELTVDIRNGHCDVAADLGIGLVYHTQPLSKNDRSLPFASRIVSSLVGMTLNGFQRQKELGRLHG